MSITDKRLTEIRARLAAATDGPWVHDDDDDDGVVNGPIYGTYISWESWPEDADFIAHARDDVPDLLAEVHRLRDELAKAREVTEDKVERVLHAVKPYVFDRLTDMDAEDMAWDATRAALGGGDDA